tara:strand:+ start:1398 stop:1706 length:309 start_codon:yes stop_codon:yes gene_type:complete
MTGAYMMAIWAQDWEGGNPDPYTDAPEKIWANKEFGSDDWDAGTFCTTDDGGTEYTRADVADARIKELESALVNIEVASGKQCGKKEWILQLCRAALKGEKT